MIFLRAPIGLAMLLCGIGGLYFAMNGTFMFMAKLKSETYSTFSSYSLSIMPMFLLMGQFATLSGMSKALFKAAESFLGHRKGGVAMAAVGACAGFGAICGSSLATAATMGQVALPELQRYGYSGGLSTATLAAGGTLGILIPPSVILVIYAILTEQNIAKLFLAAFVPGILAAIGYMITIAIYVRLNPDAAGTRAPVPWAERLRALVEVWPVLLIFVAGHRRHLSGLVHADRGRRGRRGRHRADRAGVGQPDLEAVRRQHPGHGDVHRDDLLHRARRGVLQHLPGAHPGAAGAGGLGGRAGVRPVHGADADPGLLPDLRLRDGFAVDDPADDPDLLPGHQPAGFRPDARSIWRSGSAFWC